MTGPRTLAPLALLSALAAASGALAQPTLSGSWSASGVSEQWTFPSWGDACGPRPKPQGAPGGAVQIKQQGAELLISGAGRAWSTADCWEQMPGLARVSHSASAAGRAWRTRCATAPNDPRRASVITTTQATDTTSPDDVDALPATRGASPAGERDPAADAEIASGTIGGRTAVAEDAARARKETFVAIVGGLAAALGLGGFVLLRRGRRRAAPPADVAEDVPEGDDEPPEMPEHAATPPAATAPADQNAAARRGKICPTCGKRYPNDAGFCGRDGTQLVLLN